MISVVIPVYNTEMYLPEAIDSVIQQKVDDWELILVDDGSTDASHSICDEYAAKDGRITALHTENQGVSAARNSGLALARGEWVLFLDSDDYLSQNAFEVLLQYAQPDVDMVSFSIRLVQDSDKLFCCVDKPTLFSSPAETAGIYPRLKENFFFVSACRLYRRERISHQFRLGVQQNEDGLFQSEFLLHCGKLYLIPDEILNYRYVAGRASLRTHPFDLRVIEAKFDIADMLCDVYAARREICADIWDYYLRFLKGYIQDLCRAESVAEKDHELIVAIIQSSIVDYRRIPAEILPEESQSFQEALLGLSAEKLIKFCLSSKKGE